MEKQVKILQDFGYSEHEYNGDTLAERGFLLDDGIDFFYAEMSSSVAKREKDTTYDFTRPHMVQGAWTAKKRQAQDGREFYSNVFYISKLK
jgi:hypothetical protein